MADSRGIAKGDAEDDEGSRFRYPREIEAAPQPRRRDSATNQNIRRASARARSARAGSSDCGGHGSSSRSLAHGPLRTGLRQWHDSSRRPGGRQARARIGSGGCAPLSRQLAEVRAWRPAGKSSPTSATRQPMATVVAPKAYSKINSQPMTGDEFPHGRIGVSIGAARDRHGRSHFRIAKCLHRVPYDEASRKAGCGNSTRGTPQGGVASHLLSLRPEVPRSAYAPKCSPFP